MTPNVRLSLNYCSYRVALTNAERNELTGLLNSGKHSASKLKRGQILLAADRGVADDDIAKTVGVGGSTVYRTKRRVAEANLEGALRECHVASRICLPPGF